MRYGGGQQENGEAFSFQMRQRVLDPGQLRLSPSRKSVYPALVVSKLVVSPPADVVRRVAQDAIDCRPSEGIVEKAVPYPQNCVLSSDGWFV
ncbi:hypothetical protein GCM10022223_43350 [Kineosporia mesophila]|uniref:Uncharacterized protein n=1 Tax=Kineosporia mesophila TaxID=566012 RepID=A0ABP6ZXW3_9ACTN